MTAIPNPQNPAALQAILDTLRETGYRFITTSPLTHARVLTRASAHPSATLQDLFGWNRWLHPHQMPDSFQPLIKLLKQADALIESADAVRSAVRISSLDDDLFLHSSYPTDDDSAVFFGPDTYRFARLIQQNLPAPAAGQRALDLGCGSGAGGIVMARACQAPLDLTLSDVNPLALHYARINALAAGVAATTVQSNLLDAIDGDFDLIVANPPYLVDAACRAYRHGGTRLGRELSLQMVAAALPRLRFGGRLLLYTGVAIVDGNDGFLADLQPLLADSGCRWRYQEIDPDVFGEELDLPAYQQVERIAAVGLVAIKSSTAS